MLQSSFCVALFLAPICAHCAISSAPPDFQALIHTTTDGLSTLVGVPHRPTSNLSYTKPRLSLTSRVQHPTHTLPLKPSGRTTLVGAPHRPAGTVSYTKSCLTTTSRTPHPARSLPPTLGEQTPFVESPYGPLGNATSTERTASSTTPPTTYNRTLDATARTATPAPTKFLPPLRPSINDTEGGIQGTKPIGPISALWVVVALSVAIFLGWLGWEVWRDWEKMMWLKRELKRPRFP
jgi:hypothetical protein